MQHKICTQHNDSATPAGVNRLLAATFLISLLQILSPGSAPAALQYAGNIPDTSLMIQQVGWQQPQQDLKLASAMQAASDAEYYLSSRLLEPLAMQGNAIAQYKLAMLYESDIKTAHSTARAVFWYQKAARNGHQEAQHNLAVAYANGEGVEQNIEKAVQWWTRAARAGHTDAQYNLGVIYATGKDGIQRNIAEAVKWWRLAAISGDAMAQYNLAAMYANGVDSVRSYCEATRWWEKSAANGFQQANMALEVIRKKQDYYSCWGK